MIKTVGELKKALEKFPDDRKIGLRKWNLNVSITGIQKHIVDKEKDRFREWTFMTDNIPKDGEEVVILYHPGAV
jgi:hypothetical protein